VSRDIAMAAGRALAESGFIDACTVERRGTPVTDPLDGTVTYPMTPVYSGVCRVQQSAAPWAGPANVGQAGIGLSALEIQLPVVGSEGITKDDVVTITACTHDADLTGKVFSVQGAHHASHKTTRRLPLMEVLS
jgi:hypothetical protein